MLPLIPFAVGVLTGAVALRLFKTQTSQKALDQVQTRLKKATVSSLETVSSASDKMRSRLTGEPVETAPADEVSTAPASEPIHPAESAPSLPVVVDDHRTEAEASAHHPKGLE